MISKPRDPFSAGSHLLGALLSVGALAALLTRQAGPRTTLHYFTFSLYGLSMILLYTFSALYHWVPYSGKKLELFRKMDHIMIFIYNAATYTVVCLITLRGAWGWALFATAWAAAIGGFFLKIFYLNAPRGLYTGIYLLMGWVVVVALWPLSKAMPTGGLIWLAIGGFFYTVGAVIYALKKPDPWPGVFGFHEIFHIFIMMGSFSHFWMIYRYVR